MEIDGKYDQNIKTPLILNYIEEPYHIWINNSYNGCGPSIRDNFLNRFKDLLKLCAVAGGLNRIDFASNLLYKQLCTYILVQ